MSRRRNQNPLFSAYHRRLNASRLPQYQRNELEKYEQWMRKNSKVPYVAFIDETYLDPQKAKHGFYAISAFILETRHVAPTREKLMRNLYKMVETSKAENNQYPRVYYHFTEAHAEKDPERPWLNDLNNGELLAAIGGFNDGQHYLSTDYYVSYDKDKIQIERNLEESRGRALAPMLLFLNRKYPGIVVVFESRNTKNDKTLDDSDKEGIERLKRTGILPASFDHIHVSPSIDPILIVPDGTGWANRRMQINGEVERLSQAGIKQTTFDAYSLCPIRFGPEYPQNPEPYQEPQMANLRLEDHIYIARGARNKGLYVSQALRSQYPTNESRSPALNTQDVFRSHDYFMQGYNQSREMQGHYDIAFAQVVYAEKLTTEQVRSYMKVAKTLIANPELMAGLSDSIRLLAQTTSKQLSLLSFKSVEGKKDG